jgi:hypothetical protein
MVLGGSQLHERLMHMDLKISHVRMPLCTELHENAHNSF